jgi:hypothetical protein
MTKERKCIIAEGRKLKILHIVPITTVELEYNQEDEVMIGMPTWLRGREGDYDRTHDEDFTVPQIAKVETGVRGVGYQASAGGMKPALPTIGSGVDEASVVVQAHQFVEQWKIERAAQQKKIERLEVENAELKEDVKKEIRKSGLLELDLAQAHNNLQTQQTQIEEYRKFMAVWKEMNDRTRAVFDRFGIQTKPREKKNAKEKRKGTEQNITKAGTETPNLVADPNSASGYSVKKTDKNPI